VQQGRVSEIPQDRYALIIGAMKCATTSLFSYLAEHPAIAPAKIKEPEFFSLNQAHRVRVDRYEDLWAFDPDLHRYAMEASTGYSKWGERGAAERIHAYGLRPKLIYVVRDPFVRIESHYNFMLQNPAWSRAITDENLVQTSNYYLYVTDYSRVFGRENLIILDYDALSSDPGGTVNRVCDFLSIPPTETIVDPSVRNVTALPKSSFERNLRRLAPSLGRRTPEVLKRPVRRALAALRPDKARLKPAQRSEIATALAPGMAQLQAEYGVDVSRWGF
jgi:hypothetical protein